MKKILLLSLFLINVSFACYNDNDSRYYERYSMPNNEQLYSGNFETHSKYYFEWKIQDRLKKIKKDKNNLDLYDDLAVAYEKSGKTEEGINVMLDLLKKHPQRYSSLSNLGTFYIHKGQYDEGLKYLNKAIEINPKAHFEREKYQIKAVEYIKELGVKPPFVFPVQKLEAKKDFADFIIKDIKNKDEQEKELIHAIVGVSGMIKFGMKNSPLLMEMMGDLYLKIMLLNEMTDPNAIKSYHNDIVKFYMSAKELSNSQQDLYSFILEKSNEVIDGNSIFHNQNNFYRRNEPISEEKEKEVINSGVKNIEEEINKLLYPEGKEDNQEGKTKDLFKEKSEEIRLLKEEYKNEMIEANTFKKRVYRLTKDRNISYIFATGVLFLLFGYMYETFLFFKERKNYFKLAKVKTFSSMMIVMSSMIVMAWIIELSLKGFLTPNVTYLETPAMISVTICIILFVINTVIGLELRLRNKKTEELNGLKIEKSLNYLKYVIRISTLLPIGLMILHQILK